MISRCEEIKFLHLFLPVSIRGDMYDLGIEYSWEFTDEEMGLLGPNDTYNDVYSDGNPEVCVCGFGESECKLVCDGTGPCICLAANSDPKLLPAQDNAENGLAAGSLQGPTSDQS